MTVCTVCQTVGCYYRIVRRGVLITILWHPLDGASHGYNLRNGADNTRESSVWCN